MFEWIVTYRMELLVGLILLWSGLIRLIMGPVLGARMGLFGAAPVVLVTWLWLFDLDLMQWQSPTVIAWICVALGFTLGAWLDFLRVSVTVAMPVAVLFCVLALGVQGAAFFAQSDAMPPPLSLGGMFQAWRGHGVLFATIALVATALVIRNRNGARGASVTRYVSHFVFALGGAYLMRLQGFDPQTVLAFALLAVHLVVPMTLGALDAGWLQRADTASGTTRRPSYPGWSGVLGLLVPLYIGLWLNVSIAEPLAMGTLSFRAVTLLSLLMLADLVVRPARAFGMHDLRGGIAFGTRTFYLITAAGLLLAAILVQRIETEVALGMIT